METKNSARGARGGGGGAGSDDAHVGHHELDDGDVLRTPVAAYHAHHPQPPHVYAEAVPVIEVSAVAAYHDDGQSAAPFSPSPRSAATARRSDSTRRGAAPGEGVSWRKKDALLGMTAESDDEEDYREVGI